MLRRSPGLLGLASFFLIFTIAVAFGNQEQKVSQVYTATVVPAGGGRSVSVKLNVNGVTSDEDAHKLAEVLKNEGQDALVKAMSKMDHGRFSPPSGIGTRVAVVRIKKTEKGQRITMVTDRPIAFAELWKSTRSTDYTIGFLQLDVDDQGKGEGTIIVAAKVKFAADDTIEVESYGISPSRMMAVRRLD